MEKIDHLIGLRKMYEEINQNYVKLTDIQNKTNELQEKIVTLRQQGDGLLFVNL